MTNIDFKDSSIYRIGVFDSGLGGLTIVKSLLQTLSNSTIYYVADTKNAPYGAKSTQEIINFSINITQYLIDKYKIDALVVACNTATIASIKRVREKFPHLTIIGTEPAIKPACKVSQSKSIGVMATRATLNGKKYQELASSLSDEYSVEIVERACVGLVEQIEAGQIDTDKTREMLKEWLEPMSKAGVDTIVLGCTHYPLVAKEIVSIMSNSPKLVDSAQAIANRVKELLSIAKERESINHLYIIPTGDIEKGMIDTALGGFDYTLLEF